MSGTIGIPANDAARYTFFAASLTGLIHPPNTAVRWSFGSDRIRGRNNLVKSSLEEGSEWLWFLDDDHCFAPDLLRRLLAHDVPVVTPVYLQRMMPFAPVVYTEREDDRLTYKPLFLPDYPTDTGLVEIRAAGTGGMLIRSEVFRSLEPPWFVDGAASEDLTFCERVLDAGFPIHCDLQAHLGHGTTSAIWPTVNGDEWAIGFQVADFALSVPIGTRDQLDEMEAAGEIAELPVQRIRR